MAANVGHSLKLALFGELFSLLLLGSSLLTCLPRRGMHLTNVKAVMRGLLEALHHLHTNRQLYHHGSAGLTVSNFEPANPIGFRMGLHQQIDQPGHALLSACEKYSMPEVPCLPLNQRVFDC